MNFERSEYEIQHFNFSAKQIKIENRLMVKRHVERLTANLAESIIKKSDISSSTADNIRGKSQVVIDNILETIENPLHEFDQLVDNYFTIPDNVLLPEDLRQEKTYTAADKEFYMDKVAELENTFKQNAFLLASLDVELKTYEDLEPLVERENQVVQLVEESFRMSLSLDEPKAMLETVKKMHEVKQKKEVPRKSDD